MNEWTYVNWTNKWWRRWSNRRANECVGGLTDEETLASVLTWVQNKIMVSGLFEPRMTNAILCDEDDIRMSNLLAKVIIASSAEPSAKPDTNDKNLNNSYAGTEITAQNEVIDIWWCLCVLNSKAKKSFILWWLCYSDLLEQERKVEWNMKMNWYDIFLKQE